MGLSLLAVAILSCSMAVADSSRLAGHDARLLAEVRGSGGGPDWVCDWIEGSCVPGQAPALTTSADPFGR